MVGKGDHLRRAFRMDKDFGSRVFLLRPLYIYLLRKIAFIDNDKFLLRSDKFDYIHIFFVNITRAV